MAGKTSEELLVMARIDRQLTKLCDETMAARIVEWLARKWIGVVPGEET